jgi:alkylated DNA repair dioxygenase AlkB
MLSHGSLLIMPAGSQFTHRHKIPKAGRKVNPRISLTFRGLLL